MSCRAVSLSAVTIGLYDIIGSCHGTSAERKSHCKNAVTTLAASGLATIPLGHTMRQSYKTPPPPPPKLVQKHPSYFGGCPQKRRNYAATAAAGRGGRGWVDAVFSVWESHLWKLLSICSIQSTFCAYRIAHLYI